MQQITKEQLTSIETVAKASAVRASEALSKLVGAPVEIKMLRARTAEIEKLPSLIISPETQVSAVILPISGEGSGSSALIMSVAESQRLETLTYRQAFAAGKVLGTQEEGSIFKEVSNIIGGAFLSALSNVAKFTLVQSVPEFMIGTMQEVVAATLAKLPDEQKSQSATSFTASFTIDFALRTTTTTTTTTTTDIITTHYLFILELPVAQKLLEALGKK